MPQSQGISFISIMTHRPIIFALLALLSLGTTAQTEAPPSADEIALGWQFSDCSHYFLFAAEASKAAGNVLEAAALGQLQTASLAAAVALVGEDAFKAEVLRRTQDFLKTLNTPPPEEAFSKTGARCRKLMETQLEGASPKIQALAAKKEAEKRK
ncbi:hypothetical protein HLB44_36235 [Aquincola sp. S2]|uniref:Uncharacterized protein n=1 Tax=Pseudaquabacterium terrae TaxID=2732868 RepID=A0ABX2EVG1_9BURK|nr:hypothetical protein [Aquabacterium terrae]NRF72414.1 hypothetical protein [Aquabacterium terrae]